MTHKPETLHYLGKRSIELPILLNVLLTRLGKMLECIIISDWQRIIILFLYSFLKD